MIFDAVKTKAAYQRFWLKSLLERAYEPSKPMGKIAQAAIADTAVAWLLGFHQQVAPVLPKALDWLDKALASDEVFDTDPNYYRFRLAWARALGIWMRDGIAQKAAWLSVCDYSRSSVVGSGFAEAAIATDRLDDEMAACYLAGSYESGIEEFEKYWGKQSLALTKMLAPRELGYALCLHKSRGELDRESLLAAGHQMLRANLEERWFGAGQATRAATWLAVVFSLCEPPLTPIETLLRAYDDMPRVGRPD